VILEVHRNYLEINSINHLNPLNKPNKDCNLFLVDPADFQLNKFFYKQVGKDYRWIDRLAWDNNDWIKYLENQNIKTYILKDKENLIGYFESIFDFKKRETEIAYFGILSEFFGKKYGGYLLSEAILKSFEEGIKRVWVHTCSLDHKNALNNYKARGMKIFKSEKINLNIN
tara:strand:- start:464 stop:976 length:513 start_codon:yes stop_codon:yes gene_type:complete